jgi:hypothetical protein
MTQEPISGVCSTGKSTSVRAKNGISLWGRAAILLSALSLGSCTILADEFTWLNRAGPIAEPQDQPPSPIVDRG